jgi:hypothetical protein
VFSGIGQWKTDRRELITAFLEVWLSDDHAIVREKFRRKLVKRFVPILSKIVREGIDEGAFHVESSDDTAFCPDDSDSGNAGRSARPIRRESGERRHRR